MLFYLGTHCYTWLWSDKVRVPLFVSRRTLAGRKSRYPGATDRWALDSGGFSELSMHGHWRTEPSQYVDEVRRFSDEVGMLDWAACQDWMCEPEIIKKTGLSVEVHQELTCANYLALKSMAPEVSWTPVIQGWSQDDYFSHVNKYASYGVDLRNESVVGIGSVCRRQHTEEIESIIRELSSGGISLHGFGFKTLGLARVSDSLTSSDSLAWSYAARMSDPLPGCSGHKNCANCHVYALDWRERVLKKANISDCRD